MAITQFILWKLSRIKLRELDCILRSNPNYFKSSF